MAVFTDCLIWCVAIYLVQCSKQGDGCPTFSSQQYNPLLLVLVECLFRLDTLDQLEVLERDAGKELCQLLWNQLKIHDLLGDQTIGLDGMLTGLIPFLEHAFSENVQNEIRCLLDIGGATKETPQGLSHASLVLGLTNKVLRVFEALPGVMKTLLSPLHEDLSRGRHLGRGETVSLKILSF